MSTLQMRLIKAGLVFLALGLLLHGFGAYFAYAVPQIMNDGSAELQTSSTVSTFTVLSALGSFCITLALVCAAGVVASLVMNERSEHAHDLTADEYDDDDDDSSEDVDE